MSGVQMKTVTADEQGLRLDRWFKVHFPALSHGQLEKLLRKGQIRVAGGRVKSNRRLETGEEIRVPPLDSKSKPAPARSFQNSSDREEDLKRLRDMIVFEDDSFLALSKPFGMAVQGGSKTKHHIDAMLRVLESEDCQPRLVHRLDKDTGGLLLVAKTRQAAQRLGDAFKAKEIDKSYWALTAGVPVPSSGTINLPIAKKTNEMGNEAVSPDRRNGKPAVTDYQVIENAERVAFVAMRPITGRTHQLRVHAQAIGTPIVGDGKYGGAVAQIEGLPRKLHLFCRSMTFLHPKTRRKMTLKADLSGHMLETWSFFSFDQKADVTWPEDLR